MQLLDWLFLILGVDQDDSGEVTIFAGPWISSEG